MCTPVSRGSMYLFCQSSCLLVLIAILRECLAVKTTAVNALGINVVTDEEEEEEEGIWVDGDRSEGELGDSDDPVEPLYAKIVKNKGDEQFGPKMEVRYVYHVDIC